MMPILEKLFAGLEAEQIDYCHWKDNHILQTCLEGEDDLDLLVSEDQKSCFLALLSQFSFVEAANPFMSYPGVHHFYGYDDALDRVVHLHVYFLLVTGESHLKNYHFPMERAVLKTSVLADQGIRIPNPEMRMLLLLLRYFVKLTSWPSLLLILQEQDEYRQEFAQLVALVSLQALQEKTAAWLPVVDRDLLAELYFSFQRGTLPGKISLGFRLRKALSRLRRYQWLEEILRRYWQITYRLLNKLWLKQKKDVVGRGLLVAITGVDGSGKSTAVEALVGFASQAFTTRCYHLGRPPATPLTWPVRAGLNFRKAFFRRNNPDRVASVSPQRNLVYALRYTVLAYERYCLSRRARREALRGRIVVCDRFPVSVVGRMDSPRIGQQDGDGLLMRWLGKVEQSLYGSIPGPDLTLRLELPLAEALERNRRRVKADKETDVELAQRYQDHAEMEMTFEGICSIDASRSLEEVLAEVKTVFWSKLAIQEVGKGGK